MSERRDAIEAAVAANDVRALRNLYQDWITEEQDKQEERITKARLEARRAIVAYLHRRAQEAIAAPLSPREGNVTSVYVASVTGEAARIARGEHEEHVS